MTTITNRKIMENGNKYIDKLSIDSYNNYGDANGK